MNKYVGKLLEFRLLANGTHTCVIGCPTQALPGPGQYVIAHRSEDVFASHGWVLFPADYLGNGFIAAPPIPSQWSIGDELVLSGPKGQGFNIPSVRHLGLCGIGDTIGRLNPLIEKGRTEGTDIALFSDNPVDMFLHPDIEIYPQNCIFEILQSKEKNGFWADFLVIDIPIFRLDQSWSFLKMLPPEIPTKLLIDSPMPCGGIADCGVCAMNTRRGYNFVCKHGPVINLSDLVL